VVEPGPDGKAVSSRGVNQDVTARRHAEAAMRESENRLRVANEAAGMGTYTADLRERRIRYGPSLCRMLDLPTDTEMALSEGFRFVHPDDQPMLRAAIAASAEPASDGRVRLELRLLRRDGQVLWGSYSAQLEFREEPGGRVPVRQVGAIFDVTDRKHAEEALREANRRKDEFLATLSHELRNPLAPLRFGLEALRLTEDAGERRRVEEMMKRQVDHMVRLIDDLLEVSRITRGKIELRKEPVELAGIARNAVEALLPQIESAGLSLDVELPVEPLQLEADAVRLAQVFSNLLNNAVKFTQRGGKISFRVSRDGDRVAVSVRDTGIGIAPATLPTIFEAFAQAPGNSPAQGGLGIGLFLARTLVEQHGGRIQASSPGAGLGSEFTIELPLLRASPASASLPGARADAEAARLRGRRVLIVDDSRDSADSLTAVLRMLGAESRAAYSGADALDVLAGWRPDAVLLDVGMPDMSGHEVARRVREHPGLRNVKLIAITGWGQEEDRMRSARAGFDHHLVKPVRIDVLADLLAALDPRLKATQPDAARTS
jgi:signal transduction histidine kinase/ActR/RegA family two-component response regulator